MPRPGLTPEQNERVREFVRQLLAKYDGNQTKLGEKLGITQSGVSAFLGGRVGTTYFMVERVAKLMKIAEWQVLGSPPPPGAARSPRELAVELARQIRVSERAIADVLAEPVTLEREGWYALWWTDEMRKRDLQLMDEAKRQAEKAALEEQQRNPPHLRVVPKSPEIERGPFAATPALPEGASPDFLPRLRPLEESAPKKHGKKKRDEGDE